jgi:hypothetical protein
MIVDVFIVGEDPVGELSRMSCQKFSTGLSSGEGDERHVFRHAQLRGDMPSGPIHEQNGVSAGLDGKRDLLNDCRLSGRFGSERPIEVSVPSTVARIVAPNPVSRLRENLLQLEFPLRRELQLV